jgi:hypothetical protein
MSSPAPVRDLHEDADIAAAIFVIRSGWDDVDSFLAREELRHHLVDHDRDGYCTHQRVAGRCPAWHPAHIILTAFPERVAA